MAESRVLLIEQDEEVAVRLQAVLRFIDYQVLHVRSAAELDLTERRPQEWLAVIVGRAPDTAALATFVGWLKRDRCHPPLLVPPALRELLCEQFRLDASACLALEQPPRYAELNELLRRAGLVRMGQETSFSRHSGPTGNSQPIRSLRRMIERVAAHETTVLITGESGTGKEVAARALHDQSQRRDKPFVAINCGAIPAELLESELFGHEKGAFTGAITARKGRFEIADGGTLFLDEIGDMSLPMQVKILRVLQERSYERVGSSRSLHCDVRIIAATHRNLEESISKGSFREDLFYRLNVFPIEMPPLRERLDDLPLLVASLSASLQASGRSSAQLAPETLHALRGYRWPGNVRELSNIIERLAVLHAGEVVMPTDLPQRYRQHLLATAAEHDPAETQPTASVLALFAASADGAAAAATAMPSPAVASKQEAPVLLDAAVLPKEGVNLKDRIETIELALIRQALEKADGVVAHAARLLGTHRTTLVEKLRKYGLQREDARDDRGDALGGAREQVGFA